MEFDRIIEKYRRKEKVVNIDDINTYNNIKDNCMDIANKYAKWTRIIFKNHCDKYDMFITINNKEYYLSKSDFYDNHPFDTLESINNNEFECSFRYNDECNCHPHYVKFTQSFPSSLLSAEEDTLDIKIQEHLIALYFDLTGNVYVKE
jgi:hypothetical protein